MGGSPCVVASCVKTEVPFSPDIAYEQQGRPGRQRLRIFFEAPYRVDFRFEEADTPAEESESLMTTRSTEAVWDGIEAIVLDAVGTLIEPVPAVAEVYVAGSQAARNRP